MVIFLKYKKVFQWNKDFETALLHVIFQKITISGLCS